MKDIKNLMKEIHEIAKSKGWHDQHIDEDEFICNAIAELFEAWEEYRKGNMETYYLFKEHISCDFYRIQSIEINDKAIDGYHENVILPMVYAGKYKPCGFWVEIADFIIRGLDFSELNSFEIDIFERRTIKLDNIPRFISQLTRYVSSMSIDVFELSNALSSAISLARFHGIDIFSVIREKNEYNKTRPYRHGGKIA